jgi:Tfp pilus assembly protein PilF
MSLLMEALKKAERAKQGQPVPPAEQSGQPGGAAGTPEPTAAPGPALSLLPQQEAAGHVETTGANDFPPILPDFLPPPIESRNAALARVEPTISALELSLDEPPREDAPASPAPVAATLSPDALPTAHPHPGHLPEGEGATEKGAGSDLAEPDVRPRSTANHVEAPSKTPPPDAAKIAAARQKARAVFSARQPARRRALLLGGAALAVVLGLLGGGIYYYWQMTSTGTMALPASAAVPTPPVVATAPQQQSAPVAAAQNPIDEPVPIPVEAPTPATAPASQPTTAAAPEPARTEARNKPEPFKENPAIRIRQSAATSQLNPTLGKAYQAFLSGDTVAAQQLYHKVRQQEPNNRDALLGLAAIALKHDQTDQAAAYYGKLLDLDPADPEALAGLVGLQGQSDPAQSESRLKKALAQSPQAGAVHFALGNLYAQQSRWAEAQQSYFRAYSSAPGNADYAFNLAVSLDHLNQSKLALDYYRRALAQPGQANFDKSSVQTRIEELTTLKGE